MYKKNETITFLKPILEDEDAYITHVRSSDEGDLIDLYDKFSNLLSDHRILYILVYRLKKLIKAANSMTVSLILSEAMERICDETIECLECDRASIFLLDEVKEELWTKVAKGSSTIRIPIKKGLIFKSF